MANPTASLPATTLAINTAQPTHYRSRARTGQWCRKNTSSECQTAGPRKNCRNRCPHRVADLAGGSL